MQIALSTVCLTHLDWRKNFAAAAGAVAVVAVAAYRSTRDETLAEIDRFLRARAPLAVVVGEAEADGGGEDGGEGADDGHDQIRVAVPVDVSGGLGFQGIGPGTTLCSAASAVGPRRIFRITVR